MGMKRSFAHIIPLIMAAAMMGEEMPPETAASLTPKEVDELRKKKRKFIDKRHEQNRIEKYDLKEFKYGEEIIYARNQKNADRKAKNKGYIK